MKITNHLIATKVSFEHNFNLGAYATLMSDIPELGEIG